VEAVQKEFNLVRWYIISSWQKLSQKITLYTCEALHVSPQHSLKVGCCDNKKLTILCACGCEALRHVLKKRQVSEKTTRSKNHRIRIIA
jgi:hypothetical protein